eukprot:CAMPEP_0206249976 /NCGR_PEP_ID=MMETSP0047_2-20121206/21213_1 /ASSEMBLY_ACC=CAM_ASM_000192 /TAXON_ID=195065 /ORGANISM="Chroomonas mesostigmatica_cf, Strain CCMP1168" /LENGTH=169 /DNA_ID=CAMNT_0053675769 /DNA_START=48 /DNA_END=557 /DNA_ORIENTATION=-
MIAGNAPDGISRALVCRHFDGSQRDVQVEWETKMYEAATRDLDLLGGGNEQPMVCSVGDRTVVYNKCADLILMVCGSGIMDELVLLEVLNALLSVLRLLIPKGGPSVSGVLDQYAKVVLAIDEMVCAGSIELLDPGKILQMSALKWDKRPKEKEERRASTTDKNASRDK